MLLNKKQNNIVLKSNLVYIKDLYKVNLYCLLNDNKKKLGPRTWCTKKTFVDELFKKFTV